MNDSTRVTDSGAPRGLSPRLRLALRAAPLLLLAAWLAQWHWRFPPRSVGASVTDKTLTLGAVVGSISAALAIYQLIRSLMARNVEGVILTSVNALILVICVIIFGIALTSHA
jgi:hypothetical protein